MLIEAELAVQEYQTRLSWEQLQTRIQTAQMWNDDNQSWVEEEQLRLDGVESWLLDQLARLEERRAVVDLIEAQLEFVRCHLDRVKTQFRQNFPY